MVGAYSATLDLLRRAGAADLLLVQDDLKLEWVDERGRATLDCPPLLAPLHLLLGLAGLRVPFEVKLQAIRLGLAVRFGRRPDGLTLAEYFRRSGQGEAARRLVWDPLALAILNEPVERAAAVLFHRVYQEAFLRDHRASRLVFPRCGCGGLMVRLAGYYEGRGGLLRRGAATAWSWRTDESPACTTCSARRMRGRDRGGPGLEPGSRAPMPSGAPCATGPAAARPRRRSAGGASSTRSTASPDRRSSRSTCGSTAWSWTGHARPARLRDGVGPTRGRSTDARARRSLAFIVSAAYRSASKTNAELVEAASATLSRYFPAMAAARVERSLVQREVQATFASTPELEALRPGPVTPLAGLYLAGDWTDTGLPATIEGAVRSGLRAADAVRSAIPGSA
jgi:hypothetical protein